MSNQARRVLTSVLLAGVAITAALLPAVAAPPTKPAAKPAASAPATPKPAAPRQTPPAAAPRVAASDDVALDAIAALVNDDPILASDVEEQLFQFVQRAQVRPDSAQIDTLRRQVLEQLIDEKVLLLEAKRQAITVNPAEVNKQVEGALAEAKQRLGGEQGFAEQLARENTTEARLRERYKADVERQMLEQRVVQKAIPRRVVPQAEAEAWFQTHKAKFPKVPPQLRLQVIQIVPAPDSVTLKAARARIDGLRKRIVAGEKFAKIAAEASDDPGTSKSGGDLSFFRRGQMEPALEDAAFALPLGKLSEPVRTAFGWHLVEAMERDTVRSPAGVDSLDLNGLPIAEVHARHIMVKVTANDADIDRGFETAKKVRELAAKGGDYAALVKRYSNYQGQATPDGDIGFVSLGALSPNIRAGLADLKPGEVSEVLPNAQGFNIFKVADRKPEREYELAEIREELPEAVAQAQFKEKYDAWLKTLRAKAQIEYRDL